MMLNLSVEHFISRANQQLAIGNDNAATSYFEAALLRDPRNVGVLFELGRIAMRLGDPARSLRFGRRILGLSRLERPALGHLLCGNALRAQGQHEAAANAFREVLRCEPDVMEALCNLGASLVELRKSDEAEHVLRAGLLAVPEDAAMWANLGSALQQRGLIQDAMNAMQRALHYDPTLGNIWLALGGMLLDTVQLNEASLAFEQAARHMSTPGAVGVVEYNHALVLIRLGRRKDALIMLAQAVEKAPQLAIAEGAMLYQAMFLCHWELVDHMVPRVLARIRSLPGMVVEPFSGLAIPSATTEDHRLGAEAYARRFLAAGEAAMVEPGHVWNDGRGRLRVGLLCADFRDHPMSVLMAGLLENVDRSAIELIAISYGPEMPSLFRDRIFAACDSHLLLNPALNISARHAAAEIAALRLDVLLDLQCYTSGTRSETLRYRPAPVQGHYIAYPSPAASEFYDFTMLDHVVAPPEAEPFFRERIYRFSDCYFPWIIPPGDLPAASRADEGLPDGAVVFVCMNQAYKISSTSFMAWCEVLKRVPNSVLWLLAMPAETAFMLRQFIEKQGLDPARMILAKHVSIPAHQARLALADIGLDALPYCSHTTAIDLLVANVPMVTIEGPTLPGRVAASILRAGGLPELVQPDATGFIAMAARLAMDARFARDMRHRVFSAFGPEGAARQLARQGEEFVALLHRARKDFSSSEPGENVAG